MDKVHPVAAGDYFGKNKFINFICKLLFNIESIKRYDVKGVDQVLGPVYKLLEQEHSILLFPEGSRGQPEVMRPFKSGVARIIK